MSETNEGVPEQIGEGLPPRVLKTLKHPCRRQILRSLDGGATSMSAPEIVRGGGIPCSLSCTGYHLRVLESHGLVAGSPPEDGNGAVTYRFGTPGGEQDVVRTLLEATAGEDRERLTQATGC